MALIQNSTRAARESSQRREIIEGGSEMALEVCDLSVKYRLNGSEHKAVDRVTLRLDRGQTTGLVGESGCGKSTLAFALMGLLPSNATASVSSANYNGKPLQSLSSKSVAAFTWTTVAMIFQSAMNSLNPVLKVRTVFDDVLRKHGISDRSDRDRRIDEVYELVSLEPKWKSAYPHELSGGMKQRVVIALALLMNPTIIIADEPTTALDALIQASIMTKLKKLQAELNFSMLLISHDAGLVAENCDTLAIMYAGKIVETGSVEDLILRPRHPYTIGLFSAIPPMTGVAKRLQSLDGYPPRLDNLPCGCRFAPRCELVQSRCETEDPPTPALKSFALCHFADNDEVANLRLRRIPWFSDRLRRP